MQPTPKQILAVLSVLMNNTDWSSLDAKRLQRDIMRRQKEAGRAFQAFLRTGAKIVTNMTTQRAEHLDPAKFIGQNWSFWKGPIDSDGLSGERDHDSRLDTLREIDWSKVIPVTMLKENEPSIIGNEKYARLRASANPTLGADDFLALWNNYQEAKDKDDSILKELYREKRITYIDFFGDILRGPSGNRGVLYLYRDGDGRWRWRCGWLGGRWGSRDVSASLQQV